MGGNGNKESMRQAMKELLGLVGLGPEEDEAREAQKPAEAVAPVQPKRLAPEQPKVEDQPKVEAPKPVVEQPKVEAPKPVVEQPKVEAPKPAAERPIVIEAPRPSVWEQPKAEETDLEETRQKVAATVERGFFSFGRKKDQPVVPSAPVADEPVFREPTFDEPTFTSAPAASQPEDTFRPPFIRPGATVIAAGATFFGDIRAEGDVEVLGKLKGNLEATGNVRIIGKVLGDVKGDGVLLEGCVVQGNITSTSTVSLDEGAMVVGDVLATDIDSKGKIKGNLQVARAATLSSTALLAGNVVAATIMMAQGAKVQGAVRIAVDPETNSLFGELEI